MSESETEWRLVLRPPHVPGVPCLRSCTCHLWRVVEGRAGEEGGTPGADGADGADGEAPAVLLHAARRVGAVLRRYRERLAAQSEALTRTFHEAESAVQELERFAMRGALGQARRHDQAVQRRHTEDGAEDRRRRPRWLRWLPLAVIPLAGLYDTWFFAGVFQFLLDVSWKTWQGWVALAPGVVLTSALLLGGVLLAEPLVRWKSRAEGSADLRRPVWWVAAGFLLLLSATVVVWASLRTKAAQAGAADPAAAVYGDKPVVLLVVALTVTAIGVKVAAHNPFADSAEAAEGSLDGTETAYRYLAGRVQERLTALVVVWDQLRATLEEALDELRLDPLLALAGQLAPDGDRPRLLPRTPAPYLELGLLAHSRDALAAHDPRPLRARRDHLLTDLNHQLAEGM